MTDALTARTLATAAALLDAASTGDRFAMRRILRSINEPGTTDQMGTIIQAAAEHCNVGVGQILGQSIRREVVDARHIACYTAHLLGLNYSHIGRQIERDHSTVMSACRRVSADPWLRAAAELIAAGLGERQGGAA